MDTYHDDSAEVLKIISEEVRNESKYRAGLEVLIKRLEVSQERYIQAEKILLDMYTSFWKRLFSKKTIANHLNKILKINL